MWLDFKKKVSHNSHVLYNTYNNTYGRITRYVHVMYANETI